MNIKLDMFEGPLDLLLHLIQKAEVDIYEIPIAKITKQYLDVLYEAKELVLELTSDFLVMAATLIAIKSRMLLPPAPECEKEEGEWPDPRHELVEKLLEYKRYKMISEMLREREEDRSRVYSRLPMDLTQFPVKEIQDTGLSPEVLLRALLSLAQSKKPLDPIRNIQREEISIVSCIGEICGRLQSGRVRFSQLFPGIVTRERIITTFLALLELIKQQRVLCRQHNLFGDITIESCIMR